MNKKQKIESIIDLFSQPSKYINSYHNNFDGIRISCRVDKIFEDVSIKIYGYNTILFGEVNFNFETDLIRLKFHNKLSLTLLCGGGYNEGDTLTKYRTIKYEDLTSQEDIKNNLIPVILEMFNESWINVYKFLNKCSYFNKE